MSTVEARLATLEAKMAAVEARLAGPAPTPASHNETPTDTFSDDKLENDWANKTVSKDLPRWKGDSMVGRMYSDCSAEWHDQASGFYEWKAKKGREEQPVRLKNNGKPWHESDTFNAKLHRTWAKRIRSLAAEEGNGSSAGVDESDSLPF